MTEKRILRDESTPDRREIWSFVERAASRATAGENCYPPADGAIRQPGVAAPVQRLATSDRDNSR
jgi:hypothetical protein